MSSPAYVPAPVEDETLPSWLRRLAADNGMPLIWALFTTGLTDTQHYLAAPGGHGQSLPKERLHRLCAATGYPEARILDMLTTRWIGTHTTGTGRKGEDVSADPRQYAHRNWFYGSGSHYCPDCLAGNRGAWLMRWKLPWTFACTQHKVFLLESCPHCGARADTGRHDGGLRPGFPGYVPKPGHCDNPRPQTRKHGTKGPCSHPLLAESARCLPAPEWLLNCQQALHANAHRPNSWWRDMRALACFGISILHPDALAGILDGMLPEAVAATWARQHQGRLDRLEESRRWVRETGADHRSASKDTTTRTPPADPLLMAAASAVALACIDDEAKLGALVEASQDAPTSALPTQRIKQIGASPELLERVRAHHLGPQAATMHFGLSSRYSNPTQAQHTWDPEHLPPLIWQDLYDQHIRSHAPQEVSERAMRRFVTIALYKSRTGTDWTKATARFRDRSVSNPRLGANVLHKAVTQGGEPGRDTLLLAVARIAEILETDHRIADYPETRRKADKLLADPVPPPVYLEAIGAGTGHRLTQLGSLTLAAAWLWTELASDDRINAPIWGHTPPSPRQLDMVTRWRNNMSPDALAALAAWGREVIALTGLQRPPGEPGPQPMLGPKDAATTAPTHPSGDPMGRPSATSRVTGDGATRSSARKSPIGASVVQRNDGSRSCMDGGPMSSTRPNNEQVAAAFNCESPRLLGSGATADTWLCDGDAIKLICDPTYPTDRLEREVMGLMRVRSPHVVALREVNDITVEGKALQYLRFEYVPGGDVDSRIKSGDIPSPPDVREFLIALLRGVNALHVGGVLHRDIKPANIALRDGRWNDPVILDLGLARVIDQDSITIYPGFIGTGLYMAPEQLRHERARKASDLFAIGVTVRQASTGLHPFFASTLPHTPEEALELIERGPQTLPDSFAIEVREVLDRLTSYAEHERGGSASNLRRLGVIPGGEQ